jgi:hypothetical protein
VRRWQVAVVSGACVATLLLLWLSFSVASPWSWWVRAAAVVTIPVAFFTTLAIDLAKGATRAEHGLSDEERGRRRRSAEQGVAGDVAPLVNRPSLYLRPLTRAWELWRDHPPKQPPHGRSGPPHH